MKRFYKAHILASAISLVLGSCYSNNCPLDNAVTCNYGFYDSEGTPISYGDTITITTLMPGSKTLYTYRKLGIPNIIKEFQDSSLIKLGYSETKAQHRRDTVLMNKIHDVSTIQLPMSFFNSVDTLIFSYRKISLKDTIKITHTSYPYVELPECGTYRFHTLESASSTEAAIDHIEISKSKVNYEGNENIKIYFTGIAE